MMDGQGIVKKALDRFKSTLVPGDEYTFSDTTLESVWKTARDIERQQGARSSMQNMRRMEPVLQSLESYSSVIDTFCQGFSPMAFVWVHIPELKLMHKQRKLIQLSGTNQIFLNSIITFSAFNRLS